MDLLIVKKTQSAIEIKVKITMKLNRLLLGLVLLVLPVLAISHGGGLDENGGHNDRKNGGYHCHKVICNDHGNDSVVSTPKKPIQSNMKAVKTGYNRKSWAHWSDFDNDCMNTRHEILLGQADGAVKKIS